eukprot:TRINITY_DN4573_c0_g1_i1.p1 TRINITY_DN4573_c0_g1~~TRINITY_DN4573_c0_g1_i1.p1  ORF type:complete len:497 (-),score=72.40 TRINITY_DN4573_c0_g1_i1:46-1536(-)
MSVELEHAIGCNVENRGICHLHPNGRDYIKAVGAVVLVGSLQDPHEQEFLQGHDDFITCLALSHRGDFIASGQQGANADVILWSFDLRRQVFCFQEQDHGIDCLCFSHDDRYLCCCGDIVDGRLFVYDTNSGLIIAWAQCSPKPTISIISGGMVKDIKRRDTNEYQFAAYGGKSLSLWHLDAEQGVLSSHPVNKSGKQSREFMCMAFTMDYEYLLAGTSSGDVAIVLMKNRVLQTLVPVCSAGVINMVCLPFPSGVRVLCGGGDGTVTSLSGPTAVDLRDDNQVRLDGPITSLSLSGDMQEVMAVSSIGTAFLVRCKDLSVKLHNQVSPGALYHVSYPMGISDMFLTCGGDGMVTLWDANDYSARLRCPMRTRAHPSSCTASEDIMIAGCSDGSLMAFDCAEGRNLWQIDNSHKGGVTCVQLSSNVRFVMSGGAEGELRVWELRTKEMASHLKEHAARVNDVKLFPNDQYAISVRCSWADLYRHFVGPSQACEEQR